MDSINLTLKPGDPHAATYTNGYQFQDAVIHFAKDATITIATFNVGTNVPNNFIHDLCRKATRVNLLVGTSPFNDNTRNVLNLLRQWTKEHPNLIVQIGHKMHVKAVTVEYHRGIIGWAGSLNLITPTLNDLMIRLSRRQTKEVNIYLGQLWSKATLLQ